MITLPDFQSKSSAIVDTKAESQVEERPSLWGRMCNAVSHQSTTRGQSKGRVRKFSTKHTLSKQEGSNFMTIAILREGTKTAPEPRRNLTGKRANNQHRHFPFHFSNSSLFIPISSRVASGACRMPPNRPV